MPELPEVETVVRTLEKQIKNRTIIDCEVIYPNIIQSLDFSSRIINQKFIGFDRRGKFLIFQLTDKVLVCHLRMEGKFYIVEANKVREKHTHVVLTLDNGFELRYNDVRKFGRMWLYEKSEKLDCLALLGYEPWDVNLTSDYLLEKYKRNNNPIKTVLLDQSIIAGIGNIYANEICFLSQINPCTRASLITKDECEEIIKNTQIVLNEAIKAGGTTIRSYTSSLGVTGLFQQNLYVHMQDKCKKCNSEIVKVFLNGRGTYYCPKCQKSKTKTVAITGTIGSGKSTVCEMLAKDFLVIDTDKISHDLINKAKEVKKEFKDCLVNNKIDRKLLANIVFNDKAKLDLLNSILHPLILKEVFNQLNATNDEIVFIEVPLLFEVEWQKYFDTSLLVKCHEKIAIERLMRDRNMTKDEVVNRINNQMSIEEKEQKAEYIIANDGSLLDLENSVIDFISKLKKDIL